MYSPWTALADTPLEVRFVEFTDDYDGCLDGLIVKLDYRLNQVEKRCVLAHELVHYDLNHDGHQPPSVEAVVDAMAARRLIRFKDLLEAIQWGRSQWEIAEHLWVTPDILEARMRTLTQEQLEQLRRAA